jgi:hypothetical protein
MYIDELIKIRKKKANKKYYYSRCDICGAPTNNYTMSMMGSFKHWLCNKHSMYGTFLGGGSMGLGTDVDGIWTIAELPFFGWNRQAIR